jgi:hypothetical protein
LCPPLHTAVACPCSNIVDFVGAGEVRPGETPGAFACEFVVQVRSIQTTKVKHIVYCMRSIVLSGLCYINVDLSSVVCCYWEPVSWFRVTSDMAAVWLQEYMAGGTLKSLVTREMLGNGRRIYSYAIGLDICLQMARGLRCESGPWIALTFQSNITDMNSCSCSAAPAISPAGSTPQSPALSC